MVVYVVGERVMSVLVMSVLVVLEVLVSLITVVVREGGSCGGGGRWSVVWE